MILPRRTLGDILGCLHHRGDAHRMNKADKNLRIDLAA